MLAAMEASDTNTETENPTTTEDDTEPDEEFIYPFGTRQNNQDSKFTATLNAMDTRLFESVGMVD